jgi:hypothetical protein
VWGPFTDIGSRANWLWGQFRAFANRFRKLVPELNDKQWLDVLLAAQQRAAPMIENDTPFLGLRDQVLNFDTVFWDLISKKYPSKNKKGHPHHLRLYHMSASKVHDILWPDSEPSAIEQPSEPETEPIAAEGCGGLLTACYRESKLTWPRIAKETGISERWLKQVASGDGKLSDEFKVTLSEYFSRILGRNIQF